MGSLSDKDMEYLSTLPAALPAGRVLVHNHPNGYRGKPAPKSWPARRLGTRGFRAWLTSPDPARLEVCDCNWAPELGQHFRVRGIAGEQL